MRPKHNRHSYKGSKFRKKYPKTNFGFYADWLERCFLPKYLTPNGSPYEKGVKGWAYKHIRKLYNAHYKNARTYHKKNYGYCIGDHFWYKNK